MMAASSASIGREAPATAAGPPPLRAPPKPLKSTLAGERFMARAMRRVSIVPAAPTTMPAMIIAGLPST